ncbi:hypothetical protein N7470_004702 [Penicillium chermesinum]|nr:hypothetical protein N7470_004702 [Penicillium chermesinum]
MSRSPVHLRVAGALRPSGLRAASPLRAAHERTYATHRTGISPGSRRSQTTPCPLAASSVAAPSLPRAQRSRGRGFATVHDQAETKTGALPTEGPLAEYDHRVREGRLRDDLYQRGIIVRLQDLFEALKSYHAPQVVHPSVESLDPQPKKSFLGSLFGGGAKTAPKSNIPENLPKGLYMYGDVGCGKTMLMDLFFETLPPNIQAKTRIHFHNFMQDVHKRMHVVKMKYGNDFDALPMVAADIAETASVLCFDEFQCTDVADAMILRRLLEFLMSHGVVLVTTSNRHPDDLYKNGIQRESFIPCITLLKTALNKWFDYLGDPVNDPPHEDTQIVWGRPIRVPKASGKAAQYTFNQLIGAATGAADYLELVRHYNAFIVTDVPGMNLNQRDLARRFITFIDAVYESRAKLVLTTEVPLANLFLSADDIKDGMKAGDHSDLSDAMRNLMDDLGMSVQALKNTSIFSGDEERFAFARALSRLAEMGSKEWVERGLDGGSHPVQPTSGP